MESLFIGAQLRDVLAAENSPVMPQEDDYGWLPQPQRTKAQFVAVGIRKLNHRKPAVERGFHTSQPSLTTILPTFPPRSMSRKACGACSIPSTTVSFIFSLPCDQ